LNLRLSRVVTAKTVVFASLFCVVVPASFGASQTQRRLRSNIDDSNTFVLQGNTRPIVSSGMAQDTGPVSTSQLMPRMTLHFSLTKAQQTGLSQLLAAQQNRRSPQYRKFLSPEEYASRFGLNTADIAKVTNWLENNGFSGIQPARSRISVSFSGTVAQAQAAFHTAIHSYSINGETHFANASDPELPKALQGVVESVGGLSNFQPKPFMIRGNTDGLKPHYTTSGGTTYLAPDDWETIYDVKPLYSSGLDGSPIGGQTYSIAVVGQSDVQLSDLHAFRAAAGLGVKDPTVVVVPGDSDPGLQSTDQAESDLDLEWAGAIAKNASILFVVGKSNGVNDAIQYAIDNNVAPILTTSYGECEANLPSGEFSALNALLQQAAAQGITVVAASGHGGAAACDTGSIAVGGLAVMFPASSQYVTAVGGTEFNAPNTGNYFNSSNNANGGSAKSYIPEIAWNDGNQAAGGGGVSTLVAKPTWQTGTGVPSDGQRDIPDLAFTASLQTDGLLFCNNGSCTNGFLNSSSTPAVTGGTSAAAPTFSGVLALLVQKTGARIGLLNPNLYSLAAISGNAFHDITGGTNLVLCKGGSINCPTSNTSGTGEFGYSAGVGYDQVTGLGSIDSFNFVEQWSEDIQLTATPANLAIQPGSSSPGSSPLPSPSTTITVTPVNNFSGPVTLACSVSSSLLANVTCSFDPNAIVPSTTLGAPGNASVPLYIFSAKLVRSVPSHRFPKFPTLPPNAAAWLVVAIALASTAYAARKYRFFQQRFAYVWITCAAVVLTMGAVSCGSGSAAGTLSLACNLPEPVVGNPYTGGLCTGSGGKAPYTYAIVNPGTGPLPKGLNLNTTTGAITGTPTVAGNSTFTMQIYDSESTIHTITQALALTVQPPQAENGTVTVTATSGSIVNTTQILVSTAL